MNSFFYRFLSCFLALIIFFGYCLPSPVSYASNVDVGLDFAKFMYLILKAGNIVIENTAAPIESVFNLLDYGSGLPWTPPYTYTGPTWDDEILNRSLIRINKDSVIIDGVEYTDIWLSNDAASKFRINLFDIETAWDLVSNSDGSFGEGLGFYDGAPVFLVNNSLRTQTYTGTISTGATYLIGNIYLGPFEYYGSDRGRAHFTYSTGTSTTWDISGPNGTNFGVFFYALDSSGSTWRFWDTISQYAIVAPNNLYVADPFEFDWVSGTIPAQVLPNDYGLNIRIPSSYTDPSSGTIIYDIGDIIIEYPDQIDKTIELDPMLNPDADTDAEFLDDLLGIIELLISLGLIDLITPEFKPYVEPEPGPEPEPTPPPSPVPSTPISDVPADWLDHILRWIQETIRQIKTSVETATETITETLLEPIRDIKTIVTDILDHFKSGFIDLFDGILDGIKVVFAPIFLLLKSALRLWHYVVEWVQATAPVFSTFIGFMSGTSYNMVLPIYAALAGPICIAIYKRFGR